MPEYFICTELTMIQESLKMFRLDNGVYPTTQDWLYSLIKNPNKIKYPNYSKDGYLSTIVKDAWKSEIIYIKYDGDNFELLSLGTDKKIGGKDKSKDILFSKCIKY